MECTKCHLEKPLAKGKRWCKECKNNYEKERRAKNKELHNEKGREQYKKKKDEIEQKGFEVDLNAKKVCTVCNIEKTLDKFYLAKCKGNIRAMCKECSSEKRKDLYQRKREIIIKQTSDYKIQKMKEDPLFKMERYCRSRIYSALKSQNKKKNKRTWKYIGCSSEFFKEWIEYQLYDGMTMENYGKIWHIDHVKPCSAFDFSKEGEIEDCFNWKNLRPLLSQKNYSKNDNVNTFEIMLQELKSKVYNKLKGIKN
jgi:hypothetical protein